MANKFTKSIQDRQDMDEEQPLPVSNQERRPDCSAPDLSAFLAKRGERSARNKSFYLDAAVLDALKRTANAQNVTESSLVNSILKRLLEVE